MNLTLDFPEDHPAVPGHFPGNPVVPAVVIIQETAQALFLATGHRMDTVRQLRLQKPLRPGTSVMVSCEPKDQHSWRVKLFAGGEVFAKGVFGHTGSVSGTGGRLVEPDNLVETDAVPAYRLMPHAGDMALIKHFSDIGKGRARTVVRQGDGHPLATGGKLLPWVALEYAAQLHGCQSLLGSAPATLSSNMDQAYLVMVRTLQAGFDLDVPSGAEVELDLQVVSDQGNAAQCEFDARIGQRLWCAGAFTVVSGRGRV